MNNAHRRCINNGCQRIQKCDGQHRCELNAEMSAPFDLAPLPTQAPAEGDKWEGAEEWMPIAWELCANENGEEACTELIWEGGPIPEPWGDRWLKYEDQAKEMIAMVRKHVLTPSDVQPKGTEPDDLAEPVYIRTLCKALDAALDFAGTVAGGASWWDDVWAELDAEVERTRRAYYTQAPAPASVKTDRPFFAYDPENGVEFFKTEQEAHAYAAESLKEYSRAASFDGEWSGDVEDVKVGRVTHVAVERGDDESGYDYHLEPAAPCAAVTQPTEEQWQRIGDLIEEAIRHHHLSAWRTEDDEPLGMFDLFYGGHQGQIDGVAANHEIDLLVDSIFNELKTGWSAAVGESKPPVQHKAAPEPIRCPERLKNGGTCPHHNLQCGWPACNKGTE